jgi:hypothetical protein
VHLVVHIEHHADGSPDGGPDRSPEPHHSTGLIRAVLADAPISTVRLGWCRERRCGSGCRWRW